MNNKVVLLSIPNYNVVYMHPAIPYLTAYLRKNGLNVIQKDINIIAYDFLLSKEYLQKCLKKAKIERNREYQAVVKNIEKAKKSMRNLNVYKNFEEFKKNKKILEKAFEIICKASKENLRLYGNTFDYKPKEYYENDIKISYKSREGLLKSIENKKYNVFYDFFVEKVIPLLKKEKPILVGISVSDQKQLVTSFILSSIIKDSGINTKIVLGGNVITRNYDVLSNDDKFNRKLFNYIDFIIHHEGEISILRLAKRLLNGKSNNFGTIPKLIYMKNGKIFENLEFNTMHINEIPTPDFDGFDLKFYWTPKPILPYLTKRGCPHSCTFCDIPFGYDSYYKSIEIKTGKKFKIVNKHSNLRFPPLQKQIEEIKYLKEKYNSKYFSFGDEELLSSFLEPFSKKLIEENINIIWECYAIMEPKFKDKNFVNLLSKAGCRFLQFGLESVSQKILNYENKMANASDYKRILENTAKAGIMNHVFFLIGTPYDNLFEAIKTLAFLEENGNFIHTIKPITYKCSKWSLNALNPKLKGLSIDEKTPDLDVNLNMEEKPIYGMSIHQARIAVKILELWVKYKHKINPVTRSYIYAQRLFITPKQIAKFAKNSKPEKMNLIEEEILAKFDEIFKKELKKFAYVSREEYIDENIKKEYPNFNIFDRKKKTEIIKKFARLNNFKKKRRIFFDKTYKLLKSKKQPLILDEIIDFSKKLQKIDNSLDSYK